MKVGLMTAGLGLALAMGAVPMSATGASAAPMAAAPLATNPVLTPAVATGREAKLILVRGGCGWGAHRTFAGRCHLNYGWRGHVRAHRWWHRRWHRW